MKLFQAIVLNVFLWLGLGFISAAHALTANIQGVVLETEEIGGFAGTCVVIAGDYSGFRVIATEIGKAPKICIDRTRERVNGVEFQNVTFLATEASDEIRTVGFEHDFLNGPQGLVYTKTRLKGFFATATGVGVPTGSQVWFTGVFNQAGHDELISEELTQDVGEVLDSALLSHETRSQFILSGPRVLKGVLKFTLLNNGDKLVLGSDTAVIIDNLEQRQ
jgi:hypothetical protein